MSSLRALAVLTALLFTAMALYTAPLSPSIPELQCTFTQGRFRDILSAWTPDGVSRFRNHFWIDFPFLLCYGALGYRLVTQTRLFRHFTPTTRRTLTYAMPLAALTDGLENGLHLYSVLSLTLPAEPFFLLAGIIASVKWLLIAAFVSVSGFALIRRGSDKS